VEQEAIAVESSEQGGGAVVDEIGEALEGWQGVVAELCSRDGCTAQRATKAVSMAFSSRSSAASSG
jgi:hypothetical protein